MCIRDSRRVSSTGLRAWMSQLKSPATAMATQSAHRAPGIDVHRQDGPALEPNPRRQELAVRPVSP
eukprot:656922-Alexandrium_andersonii.AAC.1